MSGDDAVAKFKQQITEALNAKASNNGDGKIHFTPECRLPDAFWNDTPGVLGDRLRHVRQAALARTVAPTAVLFAVLARVTSMIPHVLRLPPIVAGDSPLSIYVMILGGPAAGKSGASRVARLLLPNACSNYLDVYCDNAPIGSGQGIVEMLFDAVKDEATKKTMKVLTRHNAFLMLDEGDALKGLESNTGSILLSTLCTLWSGDTTGQTNATVELRRNLPEGSYTYGVVIAVQPVNAGTILAKDALGVPQRVLWAPAITGRGKTAPIGEKPPWPGPLDWTAPEKHEIEHLAEDRIDGWPRHYLTVHPDVEAEIVAQVHGVQDEQVTVAPMDEHRMLTRLRVAGALAILGGGYHVSSELWAIADVIMTASSATRDVVVAINRQEVERQTTAQGYVEGRREIVRRQVVEDDAAERCARRIVAAVSSGITARRAVARKIGGAAKAFADGLTYAAEHRWVTITQEPTGSDNKKPRGRTRTRSQAGEMRGDCTVEMHCRTSTVDDSPAALNRPITHTQ